MVPRFTRAAGALALAALLLAGGTADGTEDVALSSRRIDLEPEVPGRVAVGRLVWRGGVELRSPDKRFGGLSGLLVSADGARLLAVGDQGTWLRARLRYDGEGRLSGVEASQMAPMLGLDGAPLAGKRWQDAEALADPGNGSVLVAFERTHRLWRYRGTDGPLAAVPTAWPAPEGLGAAPANGGLEAVVALEDGRLLAITESQAAGADLAAYLWTGGRWTRLTYAREGAFSPTGATRLPGGDIVVLERRYLPLAGATVRLVQLPAGAVRPGARLAGRELARWGAPLTIDNFEGIAARRGPGGETLLYLLSDDNFNALQRTLLLVFALEE